MLLEVSERYAILTDNKEIRFLGTPLPSWLFGSGYQGEVIKQLSSKPLGNLAVIKKKRQANDKD